MQGGCQRRRQFESVYYDEKQDWGMVHLTGWAKLDAWDDEESGCFMGSTGCALFCEVCVACFYTWKPTSTACELSMNPSITNQKKPW